VLKNFSEARQQNPGVDLAPFNEKVGNH